LLYRYKVEEKWPGIYIISGVVMPMQIIDSCKLSGREDKWLRDLSNLLELPKLEQEKGDRLMQINSWLGSTYYAVILRANKKTVLEDLRMGNSDLASTLKMICKEGGLLEIWESESEARGLSKGIAVGKAIDIAEGKEEKATEIAMNLLRKGFSIEQASELSGLEVKKIMAFSA
jgi:hypothetical protein